MERKGRKLPGMKILMPDAVETPTMNLEDRCKIKLTNESEEIEIVATDLVVIEELGKGGYGIVEKMRHVHSNLIMAVKRIKSSMNDQSQKQMLTELDACKRSDCCPQMVRFYGAMFREGDVWICMEVMDTSLDKFYRQAYKLGKKIPEAFISKMSLSVIEGLNFMKEQLNLIHRDVKPSNILLNRHGQVKICDFGISGHLTNSLAKTVQAGCKPYMPPERIDGETKTAYDVRADVWSLGITIIEIATGTHPYAKWKTPFDQLKQVVREPPPKLPMNEGFSEECQLFVQRCLEKDYNNRPKYPELLAMKFIEAARNDKQFSMSRFINEILDM
ncbi:unnamed protein product [Caenorhabditis angaria]|uniref:mitogen-activated protein kinase kinase n=1 Tax=Caenorhabditis angaria TaxID=860376 RepID=A0A9P1N7T7_9PELO|nr:unnamed protein product [Caenorhabditis angaria]